jgi:hypothetical protein
MWFEKELARYQNDTRAALSLFLPLPDGHNPVRFDAFARAGLLTGIARDWENQLLSGSRLLAASVPSHKMADTMRHARHLVRCAGRPGTNILDALDPTTPAEFAHQTREERARLALRRAFGVPSIYPDKVRKSIIGAGPQKTRRGNPGIRA